MWMNSALRKWALIKWQIDGGLEFRRMKVGEDMEENERKVDLHIENKRALKIENKRKWHIYNNIIYDTRLYLWSMNMINLVLANITRVDLVILHV